MNRPALEFWFEFASTYSYPAAMRIEETAGKADVDVIWRPFLLGPIFKSQQGLKDSPFNVVSPKGDRFLMNTMTNEASVAPVTVILNWRPPSTP